MSKRIFIPAAAAAVIIVLAALYMIHIVDKVYLAGEETARNITVDSDTIDKLAEKGDMDGILVTTERIRNYNVESSENRFAVMMITVTAAVMILVLFLTCLYIYKRVLKPFDELKSYASELSKGNFDKPLKVSRGNYFGDFTWAFDNMRCELARKREGEKNAIENNKTVISSLSHDIKTPIASIRAYAEAFEANMDSTPEKKEKYLRIIMEKCDEVTRLTNDLFIHSISEMNKLDVKLEKLDIAQFIDKRVRALYVNEQDVNISLPKSEGIYISADPKRLLQVFENLKNNAEKYARTKVEISLREIPDESSGKNIVNISFRDFGPGIDDAEIPFITDKFYRGRNVGEENGSGLGLYIVRELVEKMNGTIQFINAEPGLKIEIKFPLAFDNRLC